MAVDHPRYGSQVKVTVVGETRGKYGLDNGCRRQYSI
jgi:hypothetical protein